jgi:hypothetical protein
MLRRAFVDVASRFFDVASRFFDVASPPPSVNPRQARLSGHRTAVYLLFTFFLPANPTAMRQGKNPFGSSLFGLLK